MKRSRAFALCFLSLLPAFPFIPPAAAATITRTVEKSGPVIVISGQSMPGDAAKFAAVVASAPLDPSTIVDLSGPGGMVLDGLRIGDVIHRLGWATRVNDGRACFSTCAYIWLAGHRRLMSSDAHLAFHAIFDGRTHTITDVGRHMTALYAKDIELNPETVAFVTTKGPGEGFTWLDAPKAKTLSLDMEVVPSAKRQVGRFSTEAIDRVEGAAALVREKGLDALYQDISACYTGYRRDRGDEKGFQCFVLESAGIAMAAKRAKTEGHRVDRRFTSNAVVKRIINALFATGHSRIQARKLAVRWEADLHATAQR